MCARTGTDEIPQLLMSHPAPRGAHSSPYLESRQTHTICRPSGYRNPTITLAGTASGMVNLWARATVLPIFRASGRVSACGVPEGAVNGDAVDLADVATRSEAPGEGSSWLQPPQRTSW
jgi:hypothetical protein